MDSEGSGWRSFARRHWGMMAAFIVGCVAAVVGAVVVLLWFVGDAQSTGLVPSALGQWSMGNVVGFILNLVFWQLVLVGIPVGVCVVLGWLWWRRLPSEEKRGYRMSGGRGRSAGGSGGVSLLLFIAFCIKVYLDGNWNNPVGTFTLNYVVNSLVLILEWLAVIVGIPLAIALIWWLSRGQTSGSTHAPSSP